MEFVWPPSGAPSSGETIGRSALQEDGGKSADMGMSLRAQKARIVLVCLLGRYQDGREKTKPQTDVDSLKKGN